MAKTEKHTFNTKLHECCGSDPVRPAFQCVYFKNGFAYATDGYVCIKQTLALQGVYDPENLEGKALHRDSYKDLMGFEEVVCSEDGIEACNANGQKVFFEYYPESEESPAPDFERFLKGKKGATPMTFIGIDFTSFEKLNKALYAPGGNIRLQFTGIDSHILVDAIGVEDQEATMMPKLLESTLW